MVKDIGTGMYGGYDNSRAINKLYNSYTIGIYQKTYINNDLNIYIESDLFYRNWKFKNKPAEFHNVEGYSFKGLRTENVNVYGLKFLFGQTFILPDKETKFKFYLDVFVGAGFRYQNITYETFNGDVGIAHYNYLKEKYYYKWPTPQGGIKIGILKTDLHRPPNNEIKD